MCLVLYLGQGLLFEFLSVISSSPILAMSELACLVSLLADKERIIFTGKMMNEATNHEGKNRAKIEKLKIRGGYQVTFSLGLKF